MNKTIAELDINFTFEKFISPVEYLHEFTINNRHLVHLQIKPGIYVFNMSDDVLDFEEVDAIRIVVENKIPLYHLIGRLNNIIFGLRDKAYTLHKFVRLNSDYFYDLRLIGMPF
jgi:hypothetical protein